MKRKINKNRSKGDIDYIAVRELGLVMENEEDMYKLEGVLAKNYARKWKKGKFNFEKAQAGVKNLLVTPRVRKYQTKWGTKIGSAERDAISKGRLRAIMRRIKEGDF